MYGVMPEIPLVEKKYYVSFIDAYSQFTWLYLIKRKSDVFDVFLQFQAHVERLLKHKIIHVQSDWGGVNITTSIPFLISLGFHTMCLVLIHISRMARLNVSIVTLLKLVSLYLPMHRYLLGFGVMRFPLPVFS